MKPSREISRHPIASERLEFWAMYSALPSLVHDNTVSLLGRCRDIRIDHSACACSSQRFPQSGPALLCSAVSGRCQLSHTRGGCQGSLHRSDIALESLSKQDNTFGSRCDVWATHTRHLRTKSCKLRQGAGDLPQVRSFTSRAHRETRASWSQKRQVRHLRRALRQQTKRHLGTCQ